MQIGDIVYLHTSQSRPGEIRRGTVVYIHPELRYYVAEFQFERTDGAVLSYRESFFFPERAGAPDYTGTAMSADERKWRERQRTKNKKKRK